MAVGVVLGVLEGIWRSRRVEGVPMWFERSLAGTPSLKEAESWDPAHRDPQSPPQTPPHLF